MRGRSTRSFVLVIIDEDNHTFTVEGPIIDDRGWTDAVCEAQKAGRHVRCFDTQSTVEEAIAYQKRQGLTLSASIVRPAMP